MERTCRNLAILFAALAFTLIILFGLLFVFAGEQLIDFGQNTVLRVSLALQQDGLDRAIDPTDDSVVRFSINSGDTPNVIAENLQTAELIGNPGLFVDYVRVSGIDTQLEAGKYFLDRTMSTREIAQALTDSRFSEITFRILPGQRLEEVAANINANRLFDFSGQDFLNVAGRGAPLDPAFTDWVGLPEGMSVEGFLLPDTYSLDPDITAMGLRDTLLQAFINATLDIRQQAADQGLSLYEVVTLASIVQREALQTDEKPRIAGVYLNRLDSGWRLDADPTVQYALGEPGDWWPRITQADYQATQSSYNTYTIIGLPPGPIASPGLAAMQAVVEPEESAFFFFRADCRSDGYHDFAVTYEEHLANGC